MSRTEKWLHEHVPEMIDLFVTPLCTVLATSFLTLGLKTKNVKTKSAAIPSSISAALNSL